MAVLTILCASYWSAWRAREAAVEYDKLLRVSFSNSYSFLKLESRLFSKYVVDPTTTYCRILFLQDASDEIPNTKDVGVSGIVNMNAKAAVLFVLVASCFLFMLYKLMSPWFIEVLVVLFCIGGIEVLTTITSI